MYSTARVYNKYVADCIIGSYYDKDQNTHIYYVFFQDDGISRLLFENSFPSYYIDMNILLILKLSHQFKMFTLSFLRETCRQLWHSVVLYNPSSFYEILILNFIYYITMYCLCVLQLICGLPSEKVNATFIYKM